MQSSLRFVRKAIPKVENELTRGYATKVALKMKKKAAKDLANDNTANHTHVATQTCTLDDCDAKKCAALCDQPDKTKIEGHNTHKPPIGRICRFVSETDANGMLKTQYFVKTNKKVVITEQEKQQYGTNIKYDPLHQAFIDQHKDKYE